MLSKFILCSIALPAFLTSIYSQQNHVLSQKQIQVVTDTIRTIPNFELKERTYLIPDIFSPNGNGLYDAFTVYTSQKQIPTIKILRIFDRWDQVIFERLGFLANDERKGWDGSYRGKPLATDVFTYYIELEFSDGVVLQRWGDVTLLR